MCRREMSCCACLVTHPLPSVVLHEVYETSSELSGLTGAIGPWMPVCRVALGSCGLIARIIYLSGRNGRELGKSVCIWPLQPFLVIRMADGRQIRGPELCPLPDEWHRQDLEAQGLPIELPERGVSVVPFLAVVAPRCSLDEPWTSPTTTEP